MLFPWTDALKVGHELIDADHKRLVDLINSLNDAMSERRGKEVIGHTLKELVDYTVYHFGREEAIQRTNNYPVYPDHKGKHDAFITKIKEMQKELDGGNLSLSLSVMSFLKDWLSNHILVEDKKLVAFINSKK